MPRLDASTLRHEPCSEVQMMSETPMASLTPECLVATLCALLERRRLSDGGALTLTAAHVGDARCLFVLHRPADGGCEAAWAPRLRRESVERRSSLERDPGCRIDRAVRFSRPRRLAVEFNDTIGDVDGRSGNYVGYYEGDDAAHVAHALDVLAGLPICVE